MLGTGTSCRCTLPSQGTTGSRAFCGQSLPGGGARQGEGEGREGEREREGAPAAQRAQLREATRRPGCQLELGDLGVSSGLLPLGWPLSLSSGAQTSGPWLHWTQARSTSRCRCSQARDPPTRPEVPLRLLPLGVGPSWAGAQRPGQAQAGGNRCGQTQLGPRRPSHYGPVTEGRTGRSSM